jgi:hypothetical protein
MSVPLTFPVTLAPIAVMLPVMLSRPFAPA